MATNRFQDTDALLRILSNYGHPQSSPNAPTNGQGLAAAGIAPANSDARITSWDLPSIQRSHEEHNTRTVAESASAHQLGYAQPQAYDGNPRLGNELEQFLQSLQHGPEAFQDSAHSQNTLGSTRQYLPVPAPGKHFSPGMPVNETTHPLATHIPGSKTIFQASSHSSDVGLSARTPVQAVQAQEPLQDPRTIIDWPSGLRHVTRLAARNVELGERIKKAWLLRQRSCVMRC